MCVTMYTAVSVDSAATWGLCRYCPGQRARGSPKLLSTLAASTSLSDAAGSARAVHAGQHTAATG